MPLVPHLKSTKDWFYHIFYGLCIGAADIVPGFSGGTMALILGIYENLINAIKSLSSDAALGIFKLRFSSFLKNVSWDYLLAVLFGIVSSIAVLSQGVHHLLNHEIYRVYLYSLFFGMIGASVVVCFKLLKDWKWIHLFPLFIGGVLAFVLTNGADHSLNVTYDPGKMDPWLIFCGAMAITAMLLPGISGTYLLTLLGVYPAVVSAIAHTVQGIYTFHFDFAAFLILMNLGIGIICGAVVFSRVISWLLQHYHSATLSLLIGFMVGAVRSVWPFWTYEHGAQLQVIDPYIPLVSDPFLWKALAVAIVGFAIVLCMDGIVKMKTTFKEKAHEENRMDVQHSLFHIDVSKPNGR